MLHRLGTGLRLAQLVVRYYLRPLMFDWLWNQTDQFGVLRQSGKSIRLDKSSRSRHRPAHWSAGTSQGNGIEAAEGGKLALSVV